MARWLNRWKAASQKLQLEVQTLYLVAKDPRLPWYAKGLAAAVVGYALSPIDLVPDFIPIFGLLDELILIPLGIWILLKMIPKHILDENRKKAKIQKDSNAGLKAVGIILAIRWVFCVVALYFTQLWVRQKYFGSHL